MASKKKKVVKKKSKSVKVPKSLMKNDKVPSRKIAPYFDTQDRSADSNPNVEVPLSVTPDSYQTNSRPKK
ncbi:MAG: hypothetical protein B7Y39_17755 [Bdellovibrio sp. 28-41-41]|nr:MAG: hypothetical protein B7Y39_17755 [Bdellovibrio sp. 28-41-41]